MAERLANKVALITGAESGLGREMALLFAKEQFARRKRCVNIWVVKTADITGTQLEDEDMFETTPEKLHREAAGYKVMEKIAQYKASKK